MPHAFDMYDTQEVQTGLPVQRWTLSQKPLRLGPATSLVICTKIFAFEVEKWPFLGWDHNLFWSRDLTYSRWYKSWCPFAIVNNI